MSFWIITDWSKNSAGVMTAGTGMSAPERGSPFTTGIITLSSSDSSARIPSRSKASLLYIHARRNFLR